MDTNLTNPGEIGMKAMFLEYRTLRDEISESIRLQNHVLTNGGIFLGVVFGLGFIQQSSLPYGLLLVSITPISITLLFLWLIEQTRMMRAGGYLEQLERRIDEELGGSYLSWEQWLRAPGFARTSDHRIHHYSQYFVVLMFTLLSVSSSLALAYGQPFSGSFWLAISYILFQFIFWSLIVAPHLIEHRSLLGQERVRPDKGKEWWSTQDNRYPKK